MRPTTILASLLAWTSLTTAVTIKGWASANCRGASMSCPSIGAKRCCVAARWNPGKGAVSGGFSGMPPGAQGIGWQGPGRSGTNFCRTQRNHRTGNGCLASNLRVWGTFAGMSWARRSAGKRDTEALDEDEVRCESSERVSLLTLQDGTEFDLDGMSDENLAELWEVASNGTGYPGVPAKFIVFRK
ncbi:hypothetical protein SMMN14_00003 [Sphaerulina musiva]